MKRMWILLICSVVISCSRVGFDHSVEKETADRVFGQLQEEFGLHLIDHKLVHDPELKKIAANFYLYDEMSVREARLVMYNAAQMLLENFNQIYSIKTAYHHFPLTQNDLEISISFVDPLTHKRYSCGAICHASLIGGRVHYSTYVDNEERHETVLQESFVSTSK